MFKIKVTIVIDTIYNTCGSIKLDDEFYITYEDYIKNRKYGIIVLENNIVLKYEDFEIIEVDLKEFKKKITSNNGCLLKEKDTESFKYIPYKGCFIRYIDNLGWFPTIDIFNVLDVYLNKEGIVQMNCKKCWFNTPMEAKNAIKKYINI